MFPSDAGCCPGPPGGRPGGSTLWCLDGWSQGETFLADEGRREAIRAAWHPLSVDMEAAAVAHVCYVNQVPFLAVGPLQTPPISGRGVL